MPLKRKSRLAKLLKKRTKELRNPVIDRKTAKYVIQSFKKGRSISKEKLAAHSIEIFLVELKPTIESLNRVKECLDEIEYDQEWLFVVGDYGTGKTQLKNRIQEILGQYSKGVYIDIAANIQVDSIDDFCIKFMNMLKEIIMNYHQEYYDSFTAFFEQFNKPQIRSDDRIRLVVKLMKQGISRNLRFVLQFDEIDQLPDPDSFRPWANLFSNISDQIDEGVLSIIYITEHEITRLWNKDSRLIRLQSYLTERLDPGSRFEEKYIEGIANILAIYQIAENMRFTDNSIELLESFLEFQKRRLRVFRLRDFNVAAYILADMLHTFEKNGVWESVEQVKRKERTTIGQIAEESLIQLIEGIELLFTIEDEHYRAEIRSSRIVEPKWKSDGQIHLFKEIEGEFVSNRILPIEVKYTTSSVHESSQMKNLKFMIKSYPTIFFSIGLNATNYEKLRSKFEQEVNEGNIVIIPIDRSIFEPLFSYKSGISSSLKIKLREWIKVTARLEQYIQPFLEELVTKQYRLELEELRREIARIKSVTGPEPPTTEGQPYFLIATTLVALFNKTSSGRKMKSSLPNHVRKSLERPINDFDLVYSKVIDDLIIQNFLDDSGKSYRTTETWTKDALDDFCKKIKNR